MGKGLLAWWRRRIVARGLAGAALFAVPVAVAALIGFGTGFSGVAGGLSSVTNGPDAVPAAAQTGPRKLNRAVVALANRPAGSNGPASGNDTGGGSSGPSNGTTASPGTDSASTGTGTSGSGGGSGTQIPTVSTPSVPPVSLPGSGGGGTVGGATDTLNGTVNNVLGGVNDTVNGLLGN